MWSFQMSPCNSSGAHIIMKSAHFAASATDITFWPAFSALAAEPEPGRSAMTMSLTPESRRFCACACPWLP